MATRTKTLWYATRLAADVTDATLTALTQITVYTENSSRVFRSALVWLSFEDIITATGGTITEFRCACSVNGAGATTVTETDDIANSGENMAGLLGPFDFTSHFTTNYPAADAATLDLSVYFDQNTGTTLGMRNVGALIAITYEYDDSAATQYQTAIIPLESVVGAHATTETEIGTNQIPQLTGSGGLLENVAGVTVRQQFFLTEGNDELAGGTTDYTLNVRIDTGTTHTFGVSERALGSDCFKRFVHVESPSAGAVHAFKAWTTGAGALNHAAHTMYVTYQFTVSGTTEFLNSIQIPFYMDGTLGGTAETDKSRVALPYFIEEPTTITLKQSAVRLYFSDVAAVAGLNVGVGGQSYRAYTHNAAAVCGSQLLQQRIDSGGAQGAGVTVARGKNEIVVNAYRTDATDKCYGVAGIVFLNYKSAVSSQGIGAHNHTTVWGVMDQDALVTAERESSAVAPVIPESNYWVNSVGFETLSYPGTSTVSCLTVKAELASGEGAGAGWRTLMATVHVRDTEQGPCILFGQACAHYDRWPLDTDPSRMAIETTRLYRLCPVGSGSTIAMGMVMFLTYHAISFSIGNDISGSAGGSVDIDVFQEDGDVITHIGSTSRTGNGAWSLTWYDNTLNVYGEARESGTLLGRSEHGVATGSA